MRFLFIKPVLFPSDSIPPRDGHPYRLSNGLAAPGHPTATGIGTAPINALSAMLGAQKKGPYKHGPNLKRLIF